ncbi:PDZ domain-containing protein [Bacillus sp. DJP31]|uniref:PDZ domain-containing protein n=1 Tax=Bacillus sp. DJP31 TaxID=3409789 RepID=UPI003BB4B6D3
MDIWLIEFLKGIGRFFLHPVFYFFILLTLLLGYYRVKQERKHFHVRIFDSISELKSMLTQGLFAGLIISLVTLGLGMVLPVGGLVLVGLVTILLSLTLVLRLLSPAYVLGLSFLLSFILPQFTTGIPMIDSLVRELASIHPATFGVILALLLLTEGFLIFKDGLRISSPRLETSKRGRFIGSHISNRLWMIPVFLLLPGNAVTSFFPWWPLLSLGEQTFALCVVPFGIGFYQRTRGSLPSEAVSFTGKRVIALGLFILLLAVVTFWIPIMGIATALLAMIGRELLSIQQRVQDDDHLFFSSRDLGLVILGVIPKSPADKMALKVGELITKVNGISIKNVEGFYQSLQKNRAFVKLEVVDHNNEPRLVQRALYDGEHHELGLLFVQDEKVENQKNLVG